MEIKIVVILYVSVLYVHVYIYTIYVRIAVLALIKAMRNNRLYILVYAYCPKIILNSVLLDS